MENNLQIENSTLVKNVDYSTINGQAQWFILNTWSYFFNIFYQSVVFALGGPTDLDNAVNQTTQLVNWFIGPCEWTVGDNVNGRLKRYSIGEMFVGYGGIFTLVGFVSVTGMGFNVLSLVTSTSLSFMLLFFTFNSFYITYAPLCWPQLPVPFMDDVLYFFVYNIFPKCPWFIGFMVNSRAYNNDNCYSCENSMTLPILQCKYDLGFRDITYNLVFMLQFYQPGVLSWIRDTRSPVYLLYQIPYFADRINQFVNINLNDRFVYAQYVGCNYIMTLLFNSIIATYEAAVLYFFEPVTIAALTAAIQLVYILLLIGGVVFFILMDIL